MQHENAGFIKTLPWQLEKVKVNHHEHFVTSNNNGRMNDSVKD